MLISRGAGGLRDSHPSPASPAGEQKGQARKLRRISERMIKLNGFSPAGLLFKKWEGGKKLACSWWPSGSYKIGLGLGQEVRQGVAKGESSIFLKSLE